MICTRVAREAAFLNPGLSKLPVVEFDWLLTLSAARMVMLCGTLTFSFGRKVSRIVPHLSARLKHTGAAIIRPAALDLVVTLKTPDSLWP
jgi:membrane protein DedA with SNARE-associated domain